MQKFTLGTANLGFDYGVMNSKTFNRSNSIAVLEAAVDKGIMTFDTAPGYGEAEVLLGEVIGNNEDQKVITKIPKLHKYDFEVIYSSIRQSIKRLAVNKLYGILFHDANAYAHSGMDRISKEILETGLVEKIGFSAYSEIDLIQSLEYCPSWTIFQLSENIADRQKRHSQQLEELANNGIAIYMRSVFLQGLLLATPNEVPTKFHEIADFNKIISKMANKYEITPRDLCLSYANNISWSSSTIIAAANTTQLLDNLNYRQIDLDFEALPTLSAEILDPRNWDKLL